MEPQIRYFGVNNVTLGLNDKTNLYILNYKKTQTSFPFSFEGKFISFLILLNYIKI